MDLFLRCAAEDMAMPPVMHRAGVALSVYWPGCDDWYSAKVIGHVNYGDELMHILEYERCRSASRQAPR